MPIAALTLPSSTEKHFIEFDAEFISDVTPNAARARAKSIPDEFRVCASVEIALDSRTAKTASLPGLFARAASIILEKEMEF